MSRNNAAFTFIELAGILVVLSVLAVFFMNRQQAGGALVQAQKTRNAMADVEAALEQYRREFFHYPCPAIFGTTTGEADCTNAIHHNVAGQEAYIGVVPYKTLELPIADGVDGWSNHITYAISAAKTINGFEDAAATVVILQDYQPDDTVAVNLANAANITTSHAIYALLSHGADGVGAYAQNTATATEPKVVGAGYQDSVHQFINHHHAVYGLGGHDHVFFKPATPFTDGTQFDDVLVFKEAKCQASPFMSLTTQFHFDAMDVDGTNKRLTDGSAVITWQDKTGNMTIAGSANAPIYQRYDPDTKQPAILFDAMLTQEFTGNYPTGYDAGSFAVVIKSADATPIDHGILSAGKQLTSLYTTHQYLDIKDGAGGRYADGVVSYNYNVDNTGADIIDPVTGWHAVMLPTKIAATSMQDWYVGGRILPTNVTGHHFTGAMAEIIFFDEALTATDQDNLQCYLNDKWNL